MTGEQIQTPRGRFYLTDRSREQMEAAGYGFHHQSEDGRYLIMANGTKAFAIPTQPESHIKTAEMSTEQNYNMIDGMMNNAPSMEEPVSYTHLSASSGRSSAPARSIAESRVSSV